MMNRTRTAVQTNTCSTSIATPLADRGSTCFVGDETGGPAHLQSMSGRQKTTIQRIPLTRCAWCGSSLPTAASTGRPRLYCRPKCRKASYEDRRARKPGAFQVRVVERTVVETVESTPTIDEGHDVLGCVRRVCESPRAVTNVLIALNHQVRSGTMRFDGRWTPAFRALTELDRSVRAALDPDRRRRRF